MTKMSQEAAEALTGLRGMGGAKLLPWYPMSIVDFKSSGYDIRDAIMKHSYECRKLEGEGERLFMILLQFKDVVGGSVRKEGGEEERDEESEEEV